MTRLNLNIDSLALRVTNATGHEHRIRPIVTPRRQYFRGRGRTRTGKRTPTAHGDKKSGSAERSTGEPGFADHIG